MLTSVASAVQKQNRAILCPVVDAGEILGNVKVRVQTERACSGCAGNLSTVSGHVGGSLLRIRQESNIPSLLRAAGIYDS